MRALLMIWGTGITLCFHPVALVAQASLTHTNLLAYIDRDGRTRPVTTREEWGQRRSAITQAMQRVMGKLPSSEKRCALEPETTEEVDCDSYIRRFIKYRSEPKGVVGAYLLIPKSALNMGKKAPAILGLHQTHRLGQKVVVGLGDSPNDTYGVELVKRGYVVLAPPYPLLAEYHPNLKELGYGSGTMKAIWDNIRGLDLLQTLPFVNTNRGFGAIGHSLGGHNSIYTAVFDERIKIIVSSCGFDSYRDYMNGNIKGWTSERYMPKLLDYPLAELPFDFHEIVGALAPRYFFVNAPIGDTNFKWQSVDAIIAAAKPVYALYGVPERLQVRHPDCGHLFPKELREAAYNVIDQALKE